MKSLVIVVAVLATALARGIDNAWYSNDPRDFGRGPRELYFAEDPSGPRGPHFAGIYRGIGRYGVEEYRDFRGPYGPEEHRRPSGPHGPEEQGKPRGPHALEDQRRPRGPHGPEEHRDRRGPHRQWESKAPTGLRKDFEDIAKELPLNKLQGLTSSYLENDQEIKDYVKTEEFHEALQVVAQQPELQELGRWVQAHWGSRRGRTEFKSQESADAVDVENNPGLRGYLEEKRKLVDADTILSVIQKKVAESKVFAEYWGKLQALRPVYERIIADPKVQKVLIELNNRGVDLEAEDRRIRDVLGWNDFADTGADADASAGADTGVDAGADADADASADAGADTGADAGADVGADASADAGAGADADVDASADADADAGADAGADANAEVINDEN